jgi:hypothetical protein
VKKIFVEIRAIYPESIRAWERVFRHSVARGLPLSYGIAAVVALSMGHCSRPSYRALIFSFTRTS